MVLPRTFKACKVRTAGFTMVEIVLVLAIISIVATSAVLLGQPALVHFSCFEEAGAFLLAVKRARDVSLFPAFRNVRVEVTSIDYKIWTMPDPTSGSGGESFVVDQVIRRLNLPLTLVTDNAQPEILENLIFSDGEIVFTAVGSDQPHDQTEFEFVIGDANQGCHRVFRLNRVGVII